MIFFANFDDEEEEEEKEGGIDDALLGELDDDAVEDDALLVELDPLLKASVLEPIAEEDEEGAVKEGVKVFEDDEDEEVDDYDSFDDHDEM